MRTEQEIEHAAEPVIEVRDPHLLTAQLVPVPAEEIRLGEWVVLPGLGQLSPVIGIYPCSDQHVRRRWICTDNGDWARRGDRCPVLRGDPPPYWPAPSPNAACDSTPRHIPHALAYEEQHDG